MDTKRLLFILSLFIISCNSSSKLNQNKMNSFSPSEIKFNLFQEFPEFINLKGKIESIHLFKEDVDSVYAEINFFFKFDDKMNVYYYGTNYNEKSKRAPAYNEYYYDKNSRLIKKNEIFEDTTTTIYDYQDDKIVINKNGKNYIGKIYKSKDKIIIKVFDSLNKLYQESHFNSKENLIYEYKNDITKTILYKDGQISEIKELMEGREWREEQYIRKNRNLEPYKEIEKSYNPHRIRKVESKYDDRNNWIEKNIEQTKTDFTPKFEKQTRKIIYR